MTASIVHHFKKTGWCARLFMLVFGASAALALPPFYGWYVLPFSFSGLFLQLHFSSSARHSFWYGWWWGFGFFLAGLYWISVALTIDMARFGWMIPFALIGMNGALACFTAIGAWLFVKVKRNDFALFNWVMFSVCLFSSEWLRGHILTGFPWNLVGYSWGVSDSSIQAASLTGVYGLTFITILAASSLALALMRHTVPLVVSASLVIGLYSYGQLRLSDADLEMTDTTVRLVQASIAQELKWNPEGMQNIIREHVKLSRMNGVEDVDIIIWPETAVPYAVDHHTVWHKALLGNWLGDNQLLVTGAVRTQDKPEPKLWNSLVVINAAGEMIAHYDKHHLVPFGEYMPLRAWLPIEKITGGMVDFSRGDRTDLPLRLDESNFIIPLICYEIIFPRYSFHAERTGWLLNLTNDGWYGETSGPYQHAQIARFRAVEQGKTVVRAANNGISVVYDGYGRTVGSLGLNEVGALDVRLPVAISNDTVFRMIQRWLW